MEMNDRENLEMKEKVDRMYLIIVGDERFGIPGLAARLEEQNTRIENRLTAIEEENEMNKDFRKNLTFGYKALLVAAGVAGFVADKLIDLLTAK